MKSERIERIKQFEQFFKDAKKIFVGLRDADPRGEHFERLNMLCVVSGGRNGHDNPGIVEIFWGAAPYEFRERGNKVHSVLAERGATLKFERRDDGFVLVSLHPAFTEKRKLVEDAIILTFKLDPIKLSDKRYLQKAWKDFMSYMEYSSLDGAPSFFQKQRVIYLRNFKRRVIGEHSLASKSSLFSGSTWRFIKTVGLSGIISSFIFYCLSKMDSSETTSKIEKHYQSLDRKIDHLDSAFKAQTKTSSILNAGDSAVISTIKTQ